jgi:hypothetical protein
MHRYALHYVMKKYYNSINYIIFYLHLIIHIILTLSYE